MLKQCEIVLALSPPVVVDAPPVPTLMRLAAAAMARQGLQVDATPTNHTVASIGMQMIFCPPGTFTMGSPSSEAGRGGDETQHSVTLTNGFYLGKYELTQAQYETVMNGNSEGLNAKPSTPMVLSFKIHSVSVIFFRNRSICPALISCTFLSKPKS